MQRIAALTLAFAIAGNANADCDLFYAPRDIRNASLAFHHSLEERRAVASHDMVHDQYCTFVDGARKDDVRSARITKAPSPRQGK